MSPIELAHQSLDEPALAFDPYDATAQHVHPLAGLAEHGPYSAPGWASDESIVRVATLGPSDARRPMKELLEELRSPAQPLERRDYLPPYRGFKQTFRTFLNPAPDHARIDLPADLDDQLTKAESPHQLLARALTDGLDRLARSATDFDVVVFYLPPRWKHLFTADGFDLHDRVKAHAALRNMTTQILTEDAHSYRCRASVRWRLATALFAKAGGTPYKLATGGLLDPSTAYLGLAYGVRDAGGPDQQFVVCCSQMFDGQGGGLEFIAHDLSNEVDIHNPLLDRADMRRVVSRALAVYADRHAGRRPRELVIHKQTPFTDDETAGAADAWGRPENLSCLSLTRSNWRGVLVTGRNNPPAGPKYGYAVDRGTIAQLDDYSALLWVAGNTRTVTLTGRNYLQGGKGTPRPLLITRHTGAGPLAVPATQVLALSKMDWNSDSLYTNLPATINYAQVLAKVAKTEQLPGKPLDFRFFI